MGWIRLEVCVSTPEFSGYKIRSGLLTNEQAISEMNKLERLDEVQEILWWKYEEEEGVEVGPRLVRELSRRRCGCCGIMKGYLQFRHNGVTRSECVLAVKESEIIST